MKSKKFIIRSYDKMGFPCYEESMKASKKEVLARKLVSFNPILSYFDVIVVDEIERFPEDNWCHRPLNHKHYVRNLMEGEICDYRLENGSNEGMTIVERPKSLFQLKKTSPLKRFGSETGKVMETYYSVVDKDEIGALIREAEKMAEGEGKVNPLCGDDSCTAEVYVMSNYSHGGDLCDLVILERKGFHHTSLHYMIEEEDAKISIEVDEQCRKYHKEEKEFRKKMGELGFVGDPMMRSKKSIIDFVGDSMYGIGREFKCLGCGEIPPSPTEEIGDWFRSERRKIEEEETRRIAKEEDEEE